MTGTDFTLRLLGPDDRADLQHLQSRCADYFTLIEGEPAGPDDADSFLSEVPAGKDKDDKLVFGIIHDARLIGVLDLIRNYPADKEWWLGTLVLDPAVRRGGLGQRVYQAAETFLRDQRAAVIWLCVQQRNADALRFWFARGFQEVRRTRMTLKKLESDVIVLRRVLSPDPRDGA